MDSVGKRAGCLQSTATCINLTVSGHMAAFIPKIAMRTTWKLLAILLLAISSDGLAQSQSELNQQTARTHQQLDRELNAVYKRLLDTLDDEGKTRLKKAQRAWIAFRDAEADFSADFGRGGSIAPSLYNASLAELTRQRIAQLQEQLRMRE